MLLRNTLSVLALFLWATGAPADTARLLTTDAERARAHFEVIRKAEHSIDVAYFAVHQDRTGLAFLAKLCEAARAGKKVRLLLDSSGSATIKAETIAYVESQGVEVRYYHEVTTDPRTWNSPVSWIYTRLHDKIVVADGRTLLTGTENIGDEYFARIAGKKEKINFVGRQLILEGDSAQQALRHFKEIWNSSDVARRVSGMPSAKNLSRILAQQAKVFARQRSLLKHYERLLKQGTPHVTPSTDVGEVRFVRNPLHGKKADNGISAELLQLIRGAKQRIVIQTPYLYPVGPIRDALIAKAKDGIAVEIYTNSVQSGNHRLPAELYEIQAGRLSGQGIQVYQYQGRETIHGKSVIIDHETVFIGTYNLNQRSAYLDSEVGVILKNSTIAEQTLADIQRHCGAAPNCGSASMCLRSALYELTRALHDQL